MPPNDQIKQTEDCPPAKKRRLFTEISLATQEKRLLFAIPKKGRLHVRVMKMLEAVGLSHNRANRLDIAHCTKLPVTLVFLPTSDIANYVSEGDCDLGITGQDMIAEAKVQVKELIKLGFGNCKLCVQAPIGEYTDVREIAGKRIVTSFPNLTKEYFKKIENGIPTQIRQVSGSVEVACALGLADAVVDLVQTGTTMRAAGLEVVDDVMETETILIRKNGVKPEVASIIGTLVKRIEGYQVAANYRVCQYNIDRQKIKIAISITPGREGPTITNLEDHEMVGMSALVKGSEISLTMDKLQAIGAKSIVIFKLSNCRFSR